MLTVLTFQYIRRRGAKVEPPTRLEPMRPDAEGPIRGHSAPLVRQSIRHAASVAQAVRSNSDWVMSGQHVFVLVNTHKPTGTNHRHFS
jgi:hypothetical protein